MSNGSLNVRCPGCARWLRGQDLPVSALSSLHCPGCGNSLQRAAIISPGAYLLAPALAAAGAAPGEPASGEIPVVVPSEPPPATEPMPANLTTEETEVPIEITTEPEPPPALPGEEAPVPAGLAPAETEPPPPPSVEPPPAIAPEQPAATVVMERPDAFDSPTPAPEAADEGFADPASTVVMEQPSFAPPPPPAFEAEATETPTVGLPSETASAPVPAPSTTPADDMLEGAVAGGMLGVLSSAVYLLVFAGVDWTKGGLLSALSELRAGSLGVMAGLVGGGILLGLLISGWTRRGRGSDAASDDRERTQEPPE